MKEKTFTRFNFSQSGAKLTIDASINIDPSDAIEIMEKYEMEILNSRIGPLTVCPEITCQKLTNCAYTIQALEPPHFNLLAGYQEFYILRFKNLDLPVIQHSTELKVYCFPYIKDKYTFIFQVK